MNILITGTIGVGKTTIINKLNKRSNIHIINEKIDSIYYEKLFSNPSKYALIGQLDYFLWRIKLFLSKNTNNDDIYVFDRNWIDDLIFLKYHYKCGNLSKNEYDSIIIIYKSILDKLNIKMDKIIIIKSSMEQIAERIIKRDRLNENEFNNLQQKILYNLYYSDIEIMEHMKKWSTNIVVIDNSSLKDSIIKCQEEIDNI